MGESSICTKHYVEARRHHSTPNFIPKWKGTQRSGAKSKQSCINPKCTQPGIDKLIKPLFESTDKLQTTLGVKISNDRPLLLRQKCYTEVYQIFHPQTPCTSCGAIPKEGTHWCQHSPDAFLVSQHLQDTTGTEMHMSSSDYICNTCYRSHLTILIELRSHKQEPKCTLESAMQTWLAKVDDSSTDKLTKSVLRTVLHVAENLLQGKALLLPHVCQVFLHEYGVHHSGSSKSLDLNLEVGEGVVRFSSRWLLSHLIIQLNPYMHYKCVHKKFGTVLYRKGGDLLCSLSWALGTQCSSIESHQLDEDEASTCKGQGKSHDEQTAIILNQAGCIVNNLIHKEIRRSTSSDAEYTKNPSSMSIIKHFEGVNPLLVKFIVKATSTVRERQSIQHWIRSC